MLLVAGAGTLDPGVPGSLQLMTASWLPWVETRRPTVAAAVSAFLLLLLEVSVLGGGTEHVFATSKIYYQAA